ncbi:MAG TPA: type IV secretion system DNA-binding domain-containing protein, partial [Ktedonobacterales bacterium]
EFAGCDFAAVPAREVGAILAPFAPADLVAIRHELPEGGPAPESPALALPLLGVPDASAVIELLVRQTAPSVLVFCVEPRATAHARSADAPSPHADDAPRSPWGHTPRIASAESSGARFSFQELAHQSLRIEHHSAVQRAPFRLRVEVACAEPLTEAAISTLRGEVGGPSRLTQGMAWRQPALSLASTAVPLRPRSAATQRGGQTEFAIASENLRTLGFTPWGAPREWPADVVYQADLGEGVRCFALPGDAPWLPAHAVALRLPFRAGAREGMRLGVNAARGIPHPVFLPLASRRYHAWIVGETGSGKTTLIEHLALQDVHAGRGVILIDPHGDLIRNMLSHIPTARMDDVILFDPADRAFPLSLNPLDVTEEDAQTLVISSFIGLLTKLYDPHQQGIVGPRFEHNARNVMATVMSTPGNTLVEVLRAIQDDQYVTKTLLPNVSDPLVRRYWTDQIRNTNSFHRSEVLDWIACKFSHFVTDRTMRRILGQSKSSFSFRAAMDEGKIVLISLAKGLLGSANANFLGLVLLPMILQAALSRAEQPEHQRRDVMLYIDEFQNYATDSLAQMLAEARKYHLSLMLANQHIGQLAPDIRDAVIGNVGSVIAFRLGVADAQAVEAMLAPSPVRASDLGALPNYHAYARLLIDGHSCPAFTLRTEPVPYPEDAEKVEALRAASRARYGRPRAEVDEEIAQRAQMLTQEPPARPRIVLPGFPPIATPQDTSS